MLNATNTVEGGGGGGASLSTHLITAKSTFICDGTKKNRKKLTGQMVF